MAEVAKENGIDLRESHVRIMIQAGEPGALVPSIRRKIGEAWGATPYDYPGLTEVGAYAIHCQHQKQALHVNESEFIIEVISGRTFRMLDGGVLGRSDDMITIRGMNIFPLQVGEIVETHIGIGEEYQMVAYTKESVGELKVIIELTEGRNGEEVAKAIREDLRQRFEIRIEAEVVPRGTIPRSDYKSKRFVDKRGDVAN